MSRVAMALRSRRVQRSVSALVLASSLAAVGLVAHWFDKSGFPLAQAEPQLVIATAALFLLALGAKALAWSRLFAPAERPSSRALAVATGAAAVMGIALPGRIDDAVRIAIVRWHTGPRTGVSTTALSLFSLGLVDVVALTPMASAAAASSSSAGLQAGLATIAFAGFGAAGVVVALPRLASTPLARFRLAQWLAARAPSVPDASRALGLVFASWMLRGLGIYLLLHALGLDVSFLLALVYVCAAAAAGALPIGPAGAVTGAGAGAAILIASGYSATQALAVAISVQILGAIVGATAVVTGAAWHGATRLRLSARRP